MDSLIQKSDRKINNISFSKTRYLFDKLNHNNRITIIKGARGVGKTTLLLQYAKKIRKNEKRILYVAMDDLYFFENSLYDLAEEFRKNNGSLLLLDEVHKYPNWSRELKLIYDDFDEIKMIITSSSLLEIYKSESDLSRRAISYDLKELSFREFLNFNQNINFDAIDLENLLKNHSDVSYEITSKIRPIYEFNKYLKFGMYPFYMENADSYLEKLLQIINLTLEIDLPAVENLDYNHIIKLKKLIFAISTSAPFIPNISKLSERINISRQALVKALYYLSKSRIITLLNKSNKGISILSKPDKIYLNNPNMHYAIAGEKVDVGSLRESFFVNQLEGIYSITLPQKGDFYVDDKYTFEVGGKSKGFKQIKEIENSFIVRDNIENGNDNIIPLWMFGFLY